MLYCVRFAPLLFTIAGHNAACSLPCFLLHALPWCITGCLLGMPGVVCNRCMKHFVISCSLAAPHLTSPHLTSPRLRKKVMRHKVCVLNQGKLVCIPSFPFNSPHLINTSPTSLQMLPGIDCVNYHQHNPVIFLHTAGAQAVAASRRALQGLHSEPQVQWLPFAPHRRGWG